MGPLKSTEAVTPRHHGGGIIVDLSRVIRDLVASDGSLDAGKIEWRVERALRRTAGLVYEPTTQRVHWYGIKQNVTFESSPGYAVRPGMTKKRLTAQDSKGAFEVIGGEWTTHPGHTPQHLLRELKNTGMSERDTLLYRMRSFKVTYWTERLDKAARPEGVFLRVEVLVSAPDTRRPEPVTDPTISRILAKDLLRALGGRA